MALFAGLIFSDQPAGSSHKSLCIFQPLQYFSLTQPVSFSQISNQRMGPMMHKNKNGFLVSMVATRYIH